MTDITKPYIGNPNLRRQGALARIGQREDVFSGPAVAFMSGLLGAAPDEQSGSVLDPASARNSPNAANVGFALGTVTQLSPLAKMLISLRKEATTELSSAFRSGKIDSPPTRPQRPFHVDYPQASAGDGGGKLTVDIDGNPLTARYIAGRRMVGGHDESLTPDEIEEVARLLGAQADAPVGNEIGADLGRFVVGPDAQGNALRRILLSKHLTTQQRPHVFAHETGHLIDDLTFGRQIPLAGVRREADQVFSDLNSSMYVPKGRIGAKPQHFGYKGNDVAAELNAEGLRAYMQDPNYFKSVAPNAAKRYREYINSNPNLNKVIQVNSAAGTGLLGGLYEKDREP